MRQVREIIRLKVSAHVPTREIAGRLGIATSTVRETLRRFDSAGLGWPLPDDMTDGKLETALSHWKTSLSNPAQRPSACGSTLSPLLRLLAAQFGLQC